MFVTFSVLNTKQATNIFLTRNYEKDTENPLMGYHFQSLDIITKLNNYI